MQQWKERPMPLFEVAILEKPTKNEAEDGKSERLAFGPKAVIARDAQSAGLRPCSMRTS